MNRFYIGSCRDFNYRLGLHLNRDYPLSFTAKADDWELFAYWDDLSPEQARGIEGHIKRMRNSKYMENLQLYPDIINKLKSKYE